MLFILAYHSIDHPEGAGVIWAFRDQVRQVFDSQFDISLATDSDIHLGQLYVIGFVGRIKNHQLLETKGRFDVISIASVEHGELQPDFFVKRLDFKIVIEFPNIVVRFPQSLLVRHFVPWRLLDLFSLSLYLRGLT